MESAARSERLRRSWPAISESVGPLRREVRAFAGRCGVGDEPAVELAVSEAATNSIVHAFVDSAPGDIIVEAYSDDEHLRVIIADNGSGMRPRPDSPGLGLGLPLIARLTDGFEVVDRAGGGTEIRLRFTRHAGEGHAP